MRTYCDFMVWTNEDIKFERIYPDEDFWLDCVGRVNTLFTSSILPELMGKWFSRPSTPTAAVDDAGYCYCRGPDIGDMVGCDNAECSYKWFHLSCLKLQTFPKSSIWYCPECRKMRK